MILVVDDATRIRSLIIDYLAEVGDTVIGAADGREALEYLRTYPCQLVLLDVMMPIMNGWDLLKTMHADPALALIPVVIMTTAEDVREIAMEQGAIGYLPKPLDLHALVNIVQHYVGNQL